MESPHSQLIFEGSPEPPPLVGGEEFNYRFENITVEDLQLLAEKTIIQCDEIFEQILACEDLTYDNILSPFSEVDDLVQQAFCFLSTLSLIHPDHEVRTAAVDTSTALLRDSDSYVFNFSSGKKLRAYSKTKEAKGLIGEEKRYLDGMLDCVDLAGHDLPRSQRKKVQTLQSLLPELENDYMRNIAEDNTVAVFNADEVAGLDERDRRDYLIDLGKGRYGLNMIRSTYIGFLSTASNRQARQKAYEAYNSRVKDPNGLILQKAVNARQKVAKLLGYESWLQLSVEFNVAESPEVVFDMYKEMSGPIAAQAKTEMAIMEQMLEADGYSGPFQVYDWQYYEAQLLKDKYGVDLDKVREYFPLPVVLDSVLELTGQMFGLVYRQIEVQTWHPDVLAFAVDDNSSGQQIGTIYMDLFSREGKYKHTCAQTLVSGRAMPDGTYRQPSSLIIANLAQSVNVESPLLSQEQRADVFHEFGHALHDVLTKAKIPALAGLATEIDFVEIPSQLMERWAWDKELLVKHSRHHQTGLPMSEEMADALVDSKQVNVGINYLVHISRAMYDLSLHKSLDPIDIYSQWEEAVAISPFPVVDGTFFPTIFEHLVSPYGGNYYSYLYDEIFCNDMYDRFQEEGLTNPEVSADCRRKILEPGASLRGMEMIRGFLGREPDSKTFLRSLGITAIVES